MFNVSCVCVCVWWGCVSRALSLSAPRGAGEECCGARPSGWTLNGKGFFYFYFLFIY